MIRFSQAQMEALAREAESAYPRECCGLLVGHEESGDWSIQDIVPSANLSERPSISFEIDAALRLSLQKSLRGTGNAVIGHYHSHPDGLVRPSARDTERAWEAGMIWLILSVNGGVASDSAAYLFESGEAGFSPLAIEAE